MNIKTTSEEIIPLSRDVCFRQVFKQKKYLKYFLEDVLQEEIEYLDTVVEGNNLNDKECRLDIRVRLKNKTLIDIEMQNSKKGDMFKRSKFYLARLVNKSIQIGDVYNLVPKCICINVINYNEIKLKDFKTDFYFYSKNDVEKMKKGIYTKTENILKSDEFTIIFIDLTKEKDESRIAS